MTEDTETIPGVTDDPVLRLILTGRARNLDEAFRSGRLVAERPPQIFEDRRFSGTPSADQGVVLRVELDLYRSEECTV